MQLNGLNFVVALLVLAVSVWAVGESTNRRAAYGLAVILLLGAAMTQAGKTTALANLARLVARITGVQKGEA